MAKMAEECSPYAVGKRAREGNGIDLDQVDQDYNFLGFKGEKMVRFKFIFMELHTKYRTCTGRY